MLLALLFIFSGMAFASEPPAKVPDSVYQAVQKNIETAVANNDKKEADFWTARYLGLSAADPGSGHSLKNLETLVRQRKLAPKAFVSGQWDADFIDWFEKSIYLRWGADEKKVRMRHRSVEIAENRYQNRYIATIVAYPEVEFWHVLENGLVTRPLLLLMGSALEPPTLFFRKVLKGGAPFEFTPMVLNTQKRSLHYVWKPEFYDIDGDGTPEMWVRFNVAWGNGFAQILEVYRIKDDSELVLLKRFQSGDEGFVRRLSKGDVEVGSAFDSLKGNSRFHEDSHHVETWHYQAGAFKKTSEKNIPFILSSSGWKDYFLEN